MYMLFPMRVKENDINIHVTHNLVLFRNEFENE